MKLLLDTQVILMILSNDKRLSDDARELIAGAEHEIYYSPASVAEIAKKHQNSPLLLSIDENTFNIMCVKSGLKELTLSSSAIVSALSQNNPTSRSNPFAAILLAQAKEEGMLFVTRSKDMNDENDDSIVVI